MNHFRPKEVLHRAQQSEKLGKSKEASSDFALLGSYLRKKNRLTDAILMFERSIRLTPDSGRLYLEKAICEWQQGSKDQALESVDQCVRLGIEKRNINTYFTHLKKECGELPELKKRFFECWLSIDRTHFQPFLELGEMHSSLGEWPRAKIQLLQGLKLHQDNQDLISRLEFVLEKSASETEKEYFQRFKRKEISLSELTTLLGEKESRPHQIRILKADELKDLKDLVADLERELEMESDGPLDDVEPLVREFIRRSDAVVGEDGQARFDLACAFYEMGRNTEATREIEKISALSAVFPQSQILKGKIFTEQGAQVAAMGAYLEALRASQKESNSWKESLYQLVLTCLKLGDTEGALKYVAELERSDSGYRNLKQLKKELQSKLTP